MTMHMLPAMYTTTGKRKGKQKFRNAESARKAKQNADSWQQLLDKWDVKVETKTTKVRKSTRMDPVVRNVTVVDPKRNTNHIPSVDTGASVAAKKPTQQYTGDAMIGIGQLHKSNGIPVFSKQDAHDLAIMRRG